jgi:5-methylcytosine-specific restriction endonuclease McrA
MNEHAYMGALRRARKLNALPDWLTEAQHLEMVNIYRKARKVRNETRVPHVVDHIVPLKGSNAHFEHAVCGLHVPWNLQVLEKSLNDEKRNRMCPLED